MAGPSHLRLAFLALLLGSLFAHGSSAQSNDTAASFAGASPWQAGREPVEGVDYIRMQVASPLAERAGRIEVVEVFGYTCIHCANLQPLINRWKPRLADDVDFHYLPADFGGFWTPYAQAFHAAELMDLLDNSHDDLFEAVHSERRLPIHPQAATHIADWHASRGVDPDAFARTVESFGTNTRLNRSREQIKRWGVRYTPTLIVAGTWRIEPSREGGLPRMLHTADWLIERAREAAHTRESVTPDSD